MNRYKEVFMLTQQVIREALIKALSTGADYAEVYA